MSHTPGPWSVRAVQITGHKEMSYGVITPDERLWILLPTHKEANAHLIAAAPDLLAALESQARATAYFNGKPDGDKPDPNDTSQPIWRHYLTAQAREAIYKAEGRA